jgi:hypothetical protein
LYAGDAFFKKMPVYQWLRCNAMEKSNMRKNEKNIFTIRLYYFLLIVGLSLVFHSEAYSQITGVDSAYCVNDAEPDTLIASNSANTSFVGLGIINLAGKDPVSSHNWASFTPSVAGFGVHTIVYQNQSFTVNVINPPTALLDPFASVCEDDAAFFLTGGSGGGAAGGFYRVNGVDSVTTFFPVVYGSGTHTVYYVAGGGKCTDDSDPQTITVLAAPTIIFSPMADACEDEAEFTLNAAAPAGGTYSGPGVNSGTGEFDPSAAGVGTHTLSYELSNASCTSSETQTKRNAVGRVKLSILRDHLLC